MQIKNCSHNIIILTTYKGTFSDPEVTASLALRGCIYPFFSDRFTCSSKRSRHDSSERGTTSAGQERN